MMSSRLAASDLPLAIAARIELCARVTRAFRYACERPSSAGCAAAARMHSSTEGIARSIEACASVGSVFRFFWRSCHRQSIINRRGGDCRAFPWRRCSQPSDANLSVRIDQHRRRHSLDIELRSDGGVLVILRGQVGAHPHEALRLFHHRGIDEGRMIHLAARDAPVGARNRPAPACASRRHRRAGPDRRAENPPASLSRAGSS